MIAPNTKPIIKRNIVPGRNHVISLNSFLFSAGFKKLRICMIKTGKVQITPVAIPQLTARLMNWNGEVKTILIFSNERSLIKKAIILS